MMHRVIRSALRAGPNGGPDASAAILSQITAYEKAYVARVVQLMETCRKPICCVNLTRTEGDKTIHEVTGAAYKGVFFQTPEQAVRALSRMLAYQRYRKSSNKSR